MRCRTQVLLMTGRPVRLDGVYSRGTDELFRPIAIPSLTMTVYTDNDISLFSGLPQPETSPTQPPTHHEPVGAAPATPMEERLRQLHPAPPDTNAGTDGAGALLRVPRSKGHAFGHRATYALCCTCRVLPTTAPTRWLESGVWTLGDDALLHFCKRRVL